MGGGRDLEMNRKSALAAEDVVADLFPRPTLIFHFVVQAAVQYDPNEARGLGGALQSLAQQPYGPWLLAIVALGLVAHGVYNFILSQYRRIETT